MGIANRKFGYHHDQKLRVNVVNAEHPITKGLKPWEMLDETYTMADAGAGSEILLTTDHAKSMQTLGWTRQYKKSRVFCFESGHDNQTWVSPDFREVLRRGLLWCARKL
jgi:type 1 glutamine amidotransferase